MKKLFYTDTRLLIVLLFLMISGLTSQANAASCTSNCLSLFSLKLTDLSNSISATVKLVDEFGSSGASRQSTVRGLWTRPDGSTVLQSARIGTRLRADFKFATGGVPGTYTFEVVDVIRSGYTFDPAGGLEPLSSIHIASSLNQAPVAVINSDTLSGKAPLTVNYNGSGSFDPDSDNLHYLWNFGDGSTSTTQNPSHTFTVSGEFTSSLTVVDNLGASSRSSVVIKVSEPTTDSSIGCLYQCISVKRYKMDYISDKNLIKGFVRLKDENGDPVYDVTLDVVWTLPDDSTVSQTQNSGTQKRAVFKMPANSFGTYTLTVEKIRKSGYQYDPENNSADSSSYYMKF
ncbi:MAG: PKD domain-containing protein [Candidatus Thiodiazotropha sp. (ex Semelilucina semeliformis)]|nr:PKD domain-containing protein [Candidatus Thiodiazotropha sp. (ex Semelilucina semeliformis)]